MEKHCHFSTAFDRNVFAPAEAMLRGALAKFGWRIEFDKYSATTPDPRLTLRWHDNALYFSGFGTDTTVTERFRFPDGAPLFTGADALIRNGSACYPAERAVNRECRVFLGMKHGRVSCGRLPPACRVSGGGFSFGESQTHAWCSGRRRNMSTRSASIRRSSTGPYLSPPC